MQRVVEIGVCAAVTLVACSLLAGGCEKKTSPPAASAMPAAAPGGKIDWSTVTAVASGYGKGGLKTLARRMDIWYRGSRPTVELHYTGDGFTDNAGHSYPTKPDMWKGILAEIRKDASGHAEDYALSAKMYTTQGGTMWGSDSEGKKPSYLYRFEIVDDDTLRVTTRKKLNDGA